MIKVVGIKFKNGGKLYYFSPKAGDVYERNMPVVVETSRGLEYAWVAYPEKIVSDDEVVQPLKPVIRIATQKDKDFYAACEAKRPQAMQICKEKIAARGLEMKLVDCEYAFDGSKIVFYFTSSNRVDFRELVKDLAGVFRTRIELRQIGIRDETKLIGGLGVCGLPFCCKKFLSDFVQVSIKMAKEQNLSLNSQKISGACGRLMCCLRYEHETYEEAIKKTPPVNSTVKTADGVGTVIEIKPLAAEIKVRLNDREKDAEKLYRVRDVEVLRAPKKQKDEQEEKEDEN